MKISALIGLLVVWLKGKKTYLLAGLIVLATVVLVATGHLTPATTMTLLLFAAAGFPVTFRQALAEHQAQTLKVLTDIAATGAALAARNPIAARGSFGVLVQDGIALEGELTGNTATAVGTDAAASAEAKV